MANREVATAAQTSEGVQVQPTAVEIAIGKALARVSQMKHVEVKTFITDYFFPLLGKIAKEQGDQGERLDDVEARLSQLEGAAFIEDFEAARDIILRLAEVLDEVMVASGFYIVIEGKGLQPSDKIPVTLRMKYEQVGEDAKQIVLDIVDTIVELKEAAGGDDPNDPEPEPDEEEVAAGAQADVALANATKDVNTAPIAPATEAKEGGANGAA